MLCVGELNLRQSKMSKNKKTKTVLILLTSLIIIGVIITIFFLFKNEQKPKTNSDQQKAEIGQAVKNRQIKNPFEENSIQAGIEDLKIGEQILTMGKEDENNIVTAERIYIGFSQEDFRNQMAQSRQADRNLNPGATTNAKNFSLPNGMTMEEMQNLSPEERQKFREEKIANRKTQPKMNINRSQGASIQGKIMDVNENSITLKLEEGSKIIFFSSSTQIFKRNGK